MPDVYANITSAPLALIDQIASVLGLRAADPQQRRMREGIFRRSLSLGTLMCST
jgi:hypothetical protein